MIIEKSNHVAVALLPCPVEGRLAVVVSEGRACTSLEKDLGDGKLVVHGSPHERGVSEHLREPTVHIMRTRVARWGARNARRQGEAHGRGVEVRIGVGKNSDASYVPPPCGHDEGGPSAILKITTSTHYQRPRETRVDIEIRSGVRRVRESSAASQSADSCGCDGEIWPRRRAGAASAAAMRAGGDEAGVRARHAMAHIRIVPVDAPSTFDQPLEFRIIAVLCGLVHGIAHRVAHRVRPSLISPAVRVLQLEREHARRRRGATVTPARPRTGLTTTIVRLENSANSSNIYRFWMKNSYWGSRPRAGVPSPRRYISSVDHLHDASTVMMSPALYPASSRSGSS
jgi:hypothetical protein